MTSRSAILALCAFLSVLALLPGAKGEAPSAYTKAYEPETAVPLAATVCWLADADAADAAVREIRPASAMVSLDASLRVLTESGEEIAPGLADYLDATASAFIPVLRIGDAETAEALAAYLEGSGRKDVFVAAGYRDAGLLAGAAAIPHVRGMVDFTGFEGTLEEIVRLTNASGAKVAVLPEEMATYEAVRFLQGRLITVWARTGADPFSSVRLLARGVNGLVVTDFPAAYRALGFFEGGVPALLRVPFIAGHRGMPSEYVENTLPGALAAYEAGADVIECDIYLSRDGEIYVNHDQSLKRLFGRSDVADGEKLSLAELKSIPFSFSGMSGVPSSNHTPADKSRYGAVRGDETFRIPALREYFEAFRDMDVVHFVEIKSHNTAIVGALKALCAEMGTADQTVVISFNTEILEAMRREWPEMSLGALGTEGANLPGWPGYMDYRSILRQEGAEKALELLCRVLEPFNATYNPKNNFTYELARAGRHRGLTVWPWTYNDPRTFTEAYLGGVYGLTTNFAWWGSGLAIRVVAGDEELKVGEAVPPPALMTRAWEPAPEGGLTLLTLSGDAVQNGVAVQAGEAVLVWRARRQLAINGKAYGEYDLYSEPFRVRVD